jgi:hypothetical protein
MLKTTNDKPSTQKKRFALNEMKSDKVPMGFGKLDKIQLNQY